MINSGSNKERAGGEETAATTKTWVSLVSPPKGAFFTLDHREDFSMDEKGEGSEREFTIYRIITELCGTREKTQQQLFHSISH